MDLFDAARVQAGHEKLGGSKAKAKKRKQDTVVAKEERLKKAKLDVLAPHMEAQNKTLWAVRVRVCVCGGGTDLRL